MQLPGRNQSDGTAGSPGNPTGRLRIEAEHFNLRLSGGGETEACGDLGGTLNVGYIDAGDSLSYDVTAPVSGTYTINFRLANGGPASAFQVRDPVSRAVLATINVPYTGGWQSYITLSATATLPAGQQTLQLLCTANNWNLNWLELLPPGTGSGGYNGNGAYHIEAEDFISQNGTLLENCLDAGATYNIGSINEGDWLDYRINMPVGGNYQFSIRAASANGSNSIQLRTATGTVLATLQVTNTGGYQTFATFTGSVILPAGVQTLRLQVTGGYMAVNWLELSAPPGAPPLDNYALIINGNGNQGNGLVYEAENTFTVEFWVKPSGEHEIDAETTSGTAGTAGQKYVIFPIHGGDGYGSRAGMGVSVGTNGVSVYEHADNYMPAVLVWQRPTDTAWMHVAVVYRNGKPSLYINGEWKKDGVQSSRQHVYPGTQFPGGFYGSQTNGQVDEVRIWSVARTQAQIAANMNGELSTATSNTGLQGYWPMNEGSGLVLHDVSGAGRDIDLAAAGYTGANWTNGRYSVTTTAASYRYAFNGKEDDKDISEGAQDYGMRIYDTRLGRFLSIDPLTKEYPELTPYQYASNRPIDGIDLDGLEFFKKDNTSYRMDYRPVMNQGVAQGVENGIHNGISFIWNGTFGAIGELGKSVNNYFAGGYKEPAAQDPISALIQDAGNPIDQQWKGFKNRVTDIRTYEAIPGLILFNKLPLNVEAKFTQEAKLGGRTLVVDENLSPSLSKDLNTLGYKTKVFPKGTLDPDIIAYADARKAIVLTNNIKDFNKWGLTTIKVSENMKVQTQVPSVIRAIENVNAHAKVDASIISFGKSKTTLTTTIPPTIPQGTNVSLSKYKKD